jgi:ribosomal protein L11 methyltransferase
MTSIYGYIPKQHALFMNQTAPTWEVSLTTSVALADRLSDQLAESVLASSYVLLGDASLPDYHPESPSPDRLCVLTFWLDDHPDQEFLSLLPATATIQPSIQQDWVSIVQAEFIPFQAGPFYIHSSHYPPNPDAPYSLCIDAGPAFGTGQHATTFGCLELLSNLPTPLPGALLDLGTGSAILAIAMAKLFNRQLIATDIEAMAVATAKENAEKNGVGHLIETATADGFAHPLLAKHAPYSLIVANILAGPLKELAPSIAHHLAPAGTLILSGLLTTQVEDVMQHYTPLGLSLLHQYTHNNWACLLLGRQ